jgi:hypothetical protein
MAWDPATQKHCTCYYIGRLKEIGKTAELNKKFNMKIEPGFYLDIQVLASDFRGTIPNHTHRLFLDQKCYVKQYVIQKFNPENLPLYIHWFWNDWIMERLKQNDPDTEKPAALDKPAPQPRSE